MCNTNSIDASKYQLQTLKWCPRCCQCMYGNYCNTCGTKLEEQAQEITCPCCKGTGKINPIHPPYSWMTPEYLYPHAVVNSSYDIKLQNSFYKPVENETNAIQV